MGGPPERMLGNVRHRGPEKAVRALLENLASCRPNFWELES